MSTMHTGRQIKGMRMRRGWTQVQLGEIMECGKEQISRWERGKTRLQRDTASRLKNALGCTLQGLIPSVFDPSSPEACQYQLLRQAQQLMWQAAPAETILPLLQEAIALTDKHFNAKWPTPNPHILIEEEPALFALLARIHTRMQRYDTALHILDNLLPALENLPRRDREKAVWQVQAYHALAEVLLANESYTQVEEACNKGFDLAARHVFYLYAPHFRFLQAQAYWALGQYDPVQPLLQEAFAGFELLHQRAEADALRAFAAKHGIPLKTWGAEALSYDRPALPKPPNTLRGKNMSEVLLNLRIAARRYTEELSRGLMPWGVLDSMERNLTTGHLWQIEPLMQRTGYDAQRYVVFDLTDQQFETLQLRDQLTLDNYLGNCEAAATALAILEKHKDYQAHANRQFIQRMKIDQFKRTHDKTHEKIPHLLLEALRTTIPKFNEKLIERYPLSYDETALISELATYYSRIKDNDHAIQLYESLIYNLERNLNDETDKMCIYTLACFNYATILMRLEKDEDALRVLCKAEAFEQLHERLGYLPSLAVNKASILDTLYGQEKSLPYLALSYYGDVLLGNTHDVTRINAYVRERYGITFD